MYDYDGMRGWLQFMVSVPDASPLMGKRVLRGPYDDSKFENFLTSMVKKFSLRTLDSPIWPIIDLDSPKLDDFVDFAVAALGEGLIEIQLCTLVHEPSKKANATDWYELNPKASMGPKELKIPIAHEAYKRRAGVHIAGFCWEQYCSDEFRSVVENAGLRGLDYLWVQDTGSKAAIQWYLLVAAQHIGRGIHHPWIDPRKINPETTPGWWNPSTRCAEPGGRGPELRADAPCFAGPLSKLIDCLTPENFWFRGPLRLLRSSLPDADFAFCRHGDAVSAADESPPPKQRIYCNAKAMNCLLNAGVAKKSEFDPILILDRLPEGAEDLDAEFGPVPSPYPESFIKEYKQFEADALRKFRTQPRPVPKSHSDSKAILRLIKTHLNESSGYEKGATAKALQNIGGMLPRPLPTYWRDLLKKYDGFDLGNHCEIIGTKKLVKLNKLIRCQPYPDSDDHLYVADTFNGDFYMLIVKSTTPQDDCPMVMIDHETGEMKRDWDSIGAFFEDMISEMPNV